MSNYWRVPHSSPRSWLGVLIVVSVFALGLGLFLEVSLWTIYYLGRAICAAGMCAQ